MSARFRPRPPVPPRAALAAFALSFLAWGGAAEAAVVVRDVNATLDASGFDALDVDIDENGTTDFRFSNQFSPGFGTFFPPTINARVGASAGNSTVVDGTFNRIPLPNAARLEEATVSGASSFSAPGQTSNLFSVAITDRAGSGNFAGMTGFVGLQFLDLMGQTLFGFAEVTVGRRGGGPGGLDAGDIRIGQVGFNDTPGQGIVAGQAAAGAPIPEPASLALFGLAGLAMIAGRRRTRTA